MMANIDESNVPNPQPGPTPAGPAPAIHSGGDNPVVSGDGWSMFEIAVNKFTKGIPAGAAIKFALTGGYGILGQEQALKIATAENPNDALKEALVDQAKDLGKTAIKAALNKYEAAAIVEGLEPFGVALMLLDGPDAGSGEDKLVDKMRAEQAIVNDAISPHPLTATLDPLAHEIPTIDDDDNSIPNPQPGPTPSAVCARTSSDLDHANTLALSMIRIRLFDPDSNPMPSAAYRMTAGSQKWETAATADAWIEQHVQTGPATCLVEWGAGSDAETYLYSATITLGFDMDPATSLAQRLQNLGYTDRDPQANADAFRQEYGYEDSDDIASILQGWHDDPTTIKMRQQNSPAASTDPSGSDDEDYG